VYNILYYAVRANRTASNFSRSRSALADPLHWLWVVETIGRLRLLALFDLEGGFVLDANGLLNVANTGEFECLTVLRMMAITAATDLLLEVRPQVQVGKEGQGVKAAQSGIGNGLGQEQEQWAYGKPKIYDTDVWGKILTKTKAANANIAVTAPEGIAKKMTLRRTALVEEKLDLSRRRK
jgi:hypothetical protein